MAELSDNTNWSETDSSNNQTPPNGWPSAIMNPSQVEPTARAMMGAIKRFWDRMNGTITSGGSAGAYTYTPTNVSFPTAYVQGEIFTWRANFTSTGGDTLNVDGLGAKPIYKPSIVGPVAIAAGDIRSGQIVQTVYDGNLGGTGAVQLVGGIAPSIVAVAPQSVTSASYTLNAQGVAQIFVNFNGVVTITLVPSLMLNGQEIVIMDRGGFCSLTNTITVLPGGAATINGASSGVIDTAYGRLRLIFDGTNYGVS
jgi:hypothetical protein